MQDDKRFYVYEHTLNGDVVYIGSGSGYRYSSKALRCRYHLEVWELLDKKIVAEGLSKSDALDLEQKLIDEHWDSGNLFNRVKKVAKVIDLDYKELRKHFFYDSASPTYLRYRDSPSRKIEGGAPAGTFTRDGYVHVSFKGRVLLAHRVIYCIKKKVNLSTSLVIDHIDGDRANNDISNLRAVNQSENLKNKKHKLTNTGFQCISEICEIACFVVSYKEGAKKKKVVFSFNPDYNSSDSPTYKSRGKALQAAIDFRETLVKDGKVILTGK